MKYAIMLVVSLAGLTASAVGDEFGRLEGGPFFELPQRRDAHSHTLLTFRDLEALPEVLRGERSALVLAQTDEGNLAKLLVSTGLRRIAREGSEPKVVPVLVLERYETLDAGDHVSWKARGKDVTLFDGFQFDLDAGQVVPEHLGGDILFSIGGEQGPRLVALGRNRLYTFEKPVTAPPLTPGRPSSGRTVQPGDFAGRYRLIANGQWSGTLDLSVDSARTVSGHFRSDSSGSVYPVTGKVAAEPPREIRFEIQFPRARQSYQGLLWTEDKNAFAGTLTMLDHPYSFIAIREGATLDPEGIDLDSRRDRMVPGQPNRRVVSMEQGSDRYTLDGVEQSLAELKEALSQAVKAHPGTGVTLQVPESVPFERVRQTVEAIRAAGVSSIRLAPAATTGAP
jgi:biopolymer transport protein ExbD